MQVRSFIAAQQASQAAAAPEPNVSGPGQGYYMVPGGYQGSFMQQGQYNPRYNGAWQMPQPSAAGFGNNFMEGGAQAKGGKGNGRTNKKKNKNPKGQKGVAAAPVQTQVSNPSPHS